MTSTFKTILFCLRTLLPALDRGHTAINLILNYSDILGQLETSFNLSHEISIELNDTHDLLVMVMNKSASQMISQTLNYSKSILSTSVMQTDIVTTILSRIVAAEQLDQISRLLAGEISILKNNLTQHLIYLSGNISLFQSHAYSSLSSVELLGNRTLVLADNSTATLPVLMATASEVIDQVNNNHEVSKINAELIKCDGLFPQVYTWTQDNLNETNTTLQTAAAAKQANVQALNATSILQTAHRNKIKLNSINSSYFNLTEEIRKAFAAAEMVRLVQTCLCIIRNQDQILVKTCSDLSLYN